MKHTSIAIVGAGRVGATTAHALILQNITAEILLVDINEKRCQGEVYDLADTLSFSQTSKIRKATPKEASQADIILIAAGIAQKPEQSRSELRLTNKKIITDIFDSLKPLRKDSIVIIITNPVDYLTLIAQEISGLPRTQVFGTGTFLDSQRLRGILSNTLSIAEESIHAYVLGEHGESQFVAWSAAHVGGIPLLSFSQLNKQLLKNIAQETEKRVYDIIACKEATYFGIATCAAAMCANIVFDQKRTLPLSVYNEKYDVCMSMPVVLGAKGIEQILPIPLNEAEQKLLALSAKALQEQKE